jgi:hypothetical protein
MRHDKIRVHLLINWRNGGGQLFLAKQNSVIYTGGGRSLPPSYLWDSEPFLHPAASPSATAAAVAASPSSQVDAGGVVLRRSEAVVRCIGAALSRLCGRGTAVVHVSWYLTAGGDGVEELDIIGGCPPLLTEIFRGFSLKRGAPELRWRGGGTCSDTFLRVNESNKDGCPQRTGQEPLVQMDANCRNEHSVLMI